MAYKKQTFINEETVLTADHLNHIEDGISKILEELETAAVFFNASGNGLLTAYYNSFTDALSENNPVDIGIIGTFTDDAGGYNIVMLSDISSDVSIDINRDCTIHLNGNTLSFAGTGSHLNIAASNVIIDGSEAGSELVKSDVIGTSGSYEYLINCTNSNLTIDGGIYTLNDVSDAYRSVVISCDEQSNLDLVNTSIKSSNQYTHTIGLSVSAENVTLTNSLIDIYSETYAWAITRPAGSMLDISESTITVMSVGSDKNAMGVNCGSGTCRIKNSTIITEITDETSSSIGVNLQLTAAAEITECNIKGIGGGQNGRMASAITANVDSSVVINGGYYFGSREAFGLMGISRVNGAVVEGHQHNAYVGGDAKIKNSIFRNVKEPDDSVWDSTHFGALYCGSQSSDSNVYVDNCIFDTTDTTSVVGIMCKESVTKVYLSNSDFIGNFTSYDMQTDGHIHNRIYIGENVEYETTKTPTGYEVTIDATTYAGQSFAW